MQKSATACELLQGNNQKRPSLQENILGSPFSTSSKEMSRSSTMPLSGDSEVSQNTFFFLNDLFLYLAIDNVFYPSGIIQNGIEISSKSHI